MKKFISAAVAFAMAASAIGTTALAKAPDEYDNVSYTDLELTSEDTDGKINLAVIAKGDVNIYGDTMYIEGSVYSNGTIYGGNGEGNSIEGLLISGTENDVEETVDGSVIRYGYKHVNDEGHTATTNGYSVGLGTNGAILDKETSFGYSYTEYTYPEITNYVETATANQYSNVLKVSEDTHFGTVDANGAGFIIDTTNGDVTVVIDTMNVSNNPYIATVGDGHVNLYVKNWVSNNNVNLGLMNVGSTDNYNYANSTASVYDNWANIQSSITTTESVTSHGTTYNVPRPNDEVLNALDPNKIDFYIDQCNGSDDIVFNGCRIAANIHSNASKLEIGYNLEIYGNITSGAKEFDTISSGYINGTVTVPNAASTVYNSSTIQGQLITDTLLINGAGAILNRTDSVVLASDDDDDDEDEDNNTSDSGIYLNIVEDVVYVVIGDGTYPSFTLDHNTKYKWSNDSKDGALYFGSNSLGENGYYPDYFTANDVKFEYNARTAYNEYWGIQPGDTVTVTATSTEDSSVYDTAKIIFVASEDDIPKATEAPTETPTEEPEATEKPSLPSGSEINLKGVKYAYIFGYEPDWTDDGELEALRMAPEDNVTREQVCAMIMRLIDQTYDTMDTDYAVSSKISRYEGQWFERGLAYMDEKGAFDDVDTVETGSVTRGEVAKLIAFGLNLTASTDVEYTDVADSAYLPYIKIMKAYGYMNGDSDTEFRPNDHMTRAEFCSLFNNITDRNDYKLTTEDGTEVTMETYYFTDMSYVADWAYDACLRATSTFNDDGTVDLETRLANIRNTLDKYDSQKKY